MVPFRFVTDFTVSRYFRQTAAKLELSLPLLPPHSKVLLAAEDTDHCWVGVRWHVTTYSNVCVLLLSFSSSAANLYLKNHYIIFTIDTSTTALTRIMRVGVVGGINSSAEPAGGGLFDSRDQVLNETALVGDSSSHTNDDSSDSGNDMQNLFFIIPVLGFLILFVGTCYLRKRQRHQEVESLHRYNARIDALNREKRIREERRSTLVENALVTTKVIFFGRNSKMNDASTLQSNRTLDTSTSSSLASSRRGSDSSSVDDDIEQGYDTSHDVTNTTMKRSEFTLNLEDPIRGNDIELETCAICLEPYRENSSVSYSKHQNCTHAFHTHCIKSWLKDQCRNDCPCCRSQYLHICAVEEDDDIFEDSQAEANDDAETTSAGASVNEESNV